LHGNLKGSCLFLRSVSSKNSAGIANENTPVENSTDTLQRCFGRGSQGVHNPKDGDNEHSSSYKDSLKGKYDGIIPISGFIINFRPTFIEFAKATTRVIECLDWFKTVDFAYGIARGGTHCFLVTKGKLWHVHYDRIGPVLYEINDFDEFEWLSGAVVFPREAVSAPAPQNCRAPVPRQT
jgi:hypothetical protein